jgi:hypothetical protein
MSTTVDVKCGESPPPQPAPGNAIASDQTHVRNEDFKARSP